MINKKNNVNRVYLLAIGDELLSGRNLNTNGPWIAKKLSLLSLRPEGIEIVGDEEALLQEALEGLEKKATIVIATGGLGPTIDDITAKVARGLWGEPELLPNSVGSAKGLFFEKEGKLFFLLPGPPAEMRAMMEGSVLPLLREKVAVQEHSYSRRLYFFLLPETKIDPILRALHEKEPRLECGIYPSMGLVEVHLAVKGGSKEEAMKILDPAVGELQKAFPESWMQFEEESIEEAIAATLVRAKKRVCLAESMTGGSLAFRFVKNAGASQFFDGSCVVYSNKSKSTLLGVDAKLLQEKGAVSKEVAEQMAEGARQRFGSDYALAVTGIAGPSGGSAEKPVGTIYFALAMNGKPTLSWHFSRPFSRGQLIEGAGLFLLGQLWFQLNRDRV